MQSPLPVPFSLYNFRDTLGTPWQFAFAHPEHVISAVRTDEVEPALQAVQECVDQGFYAAGYVAYEAASAFDAALPDGPRPNVPLVWFGLFRNHLAFPPNIAATPEEDAVPSLTWQPSINRADYDNAIAAIREAIAAGETYQVNFTLRFLSRFEGDSFSLYQRLCAAQRGAGYCAYLDIGDHQVLSASPELFFHKHGRTVTTRPMKGTLRRGRWLGEDEAQIRQLKASAKDRAENLMIVDLLRNDLGRIAEIGSIEVPSLFDIERYPTLLQMTSTIMARTRHDVTLIDIFRALFPCGSVTGAPKVSTMHLSSALEDTPRGVYCGAIGMIKPGGDCLFNVAIRTIVVDAAEGNARYGAGGGVTWDSTSQGEYEELTLKAAILTEAAPPFNLLETLLLKEGEFVLLARHLERIAASAIYFNVIFPQNEAVRALNAFARTHPEGLYRVRLLVSQQAQVRVEGKPLEVLSDGLQKVVLAAGPVDRSDRFLYHKTTYRKALDRFRGPCACGEAFDVLLWNESRELTEFTTGNLVAEIEGRLWTPPRDCGLLAGTYRNELIDKGSIFERTIGIADIGQATRMCFINSVRGWVPVSLQPSTFGLAQNESRP